MKYIWKLSDIRPGVRLINKKNMENPEFIIGYKYAENPEQRVVCLIYLYNGLTLKESADKKDIVKYLNKHNYIPAKIKT